MRAGRPAFPHRAGGVRPVVAAMTVAAMTTALLGVTGGAVHATSGFASDDFFDSTLDPVWAVVDPLGDGSWSLEGSGTGDARLALTVPTGTSHYPYKTNTALRALQSVTDADLGVEAKFDSVPSQKYQMQGLMFEAGESTFVRFDVHHDGSGLRAFASTTVNGSASARFNVAVPALMAVWLRVVRSGSTWTMSYSGDGSAWTEAGSFSQSIALSKAGPFVGNHGSSGSIPGYTALVDYMFDMAAPIDPEDGGTPPPADTTPPVISGVSVTPSSTSAQISWGTDESTTGRVDYGAAAGSYSSSEVSGTTGTAHIVTLTGLSPATTYHFVVHATDAAGNSSVTDDTTFSTTTESGSGSVVTSDDFFSSELDTSVWSVVDPVGDGSWSLQGSGTADARLALTVPAGTAHDPYKTNAALRVMQSVVNADVGVDVKFDSVPSQKYQIQGLIFEEAASTFVRFDVHHNGSGLRAFASTTVNGSAKSRFNVAIPSLSLVWLRVVRSGSTWTMSYSGDGSLWTEVGSFSQSLALSRVGPFVGNAGSSGSIPAYTALVDYVFDTAAPIDPEDGGAPPPEDTTPPVISGVSVTPSSTSAQVSWGTNESTTGRVDYGTAAGSYGSSVQSGTTGTAHAVTLAGLNPETMYHFVIHATDAAGNPSVTDDATFTTTVDTPPSGPVIDVWYGDEQTFGIPAQAQTWANVVGNVRDADGVSSLSYKLNGGSSKGLSIGPNNRRLQDPGDFNIDIPWTSLQPGTNTVTITAVDGDGDTTSRSVTLVKESGGPLALPYTLSWSTSQPLQEQAQVVDGRWAAGSGGTVRTVQFGYDRLLAVGDLGWTDFEVTVPVTVHALGPGHNSYLSGAALVGIGLRWQGHTQVKNEQPAYGWWPTGAFAWHRFYDSGGRYELRGNDNSPVRHTTQPLTHGTTYVFKARAHTQSAATRYSFKWWVQGQPEPALWLLEIDEDAGPATGSVVLVAHHVDATFGTVTATPVSAP